MSIENENQATAGKDQVLFAELQSHRQGGSEWVQGDSRQMETLVKYPVKRDGLAEVIDQLHVLERTRWPRADYVLLVPDYSDVEFTILPARRKK